MGLAIYSARKIELLNSMNNLEMMMVQIAASKQNIVNEVTELTQQKQNISSSSSTSIWTDFASMAEYLTDDTETQAEIKKMAEVAKMTESFNGNSTENQAKAIDSYIAQLKSMEQQYELKEKAMQTSYSQMESEYEQVRSAESKEASKNAPKFG